VLLTWEELLSPLQVTVSDDKLGSGGFGGVWRGSMAGQDVAVKGFNGELQSGKAEALSEYRMLRLAPKGSAPAVYHVADDLVVMEYIAGRSMDKVVATSEKGSLTAAAAVDVVKQVAAQVAALRGVRIAHGDIKLKNLILAGDNVVRLIDFGKAEQVPEGAQKGADASYAADIRMLGNLFFGLLPSIKPDWDDNGKDKAPPVDDKNLNAIKSFASSLNEFDGSVANNTWPMLLMALTSLGENVKVL
jgi:predicted Ser/Thr protein kinase